MNIAVRHIHRPLACVAILLALGLAASVPAALAGPGAHGPDGEHLDAKSTAAPGQIRPGLEATSELFELVARLSAGGLVIHVDRYETNEPVSDARLEVESGSLKAMAAFRPGSGDYLVSDAAFLEAISRPGEHALVFTLIAGNDTDLLDGILVMTESRRDDHDHDHTLERVLWIGAAAVGLVMVGGVAVRRLRSGSRQATRVTGQEVRS